MRRLTIGLLLPAFFCAVPILGAILVAAAIPSEAQRDYLDRVRTSHIDWVILGIGFVLFLCQTILCWKALRWKGRSFDERSDKLLTHLSQAAEWFPLLGLLGTVAAILQTFSSINSTSVTPVEIIKKYAPAITATGSGLFMALINILPTWVVLLGRDVIQSLAGVDPPTEAKP